MSNTFKLISLVTLITSCCNKSISQNIFEKYEPKKNDSIRIETGKKDFFSFIQKGYILMFPENKTIIRSAYLENYFEIFSGKNLFTRLVVCIM